MAKTVSYGPVEGEDDLAGLIETHARTYNHAPEDSWLAKVDKEELRVVRRGGKVVGGLRLVPAGQWFGGRSVKQTGIGAVGIEPAERATGLGAELMRRTLEEIHAQGAPTSTLYPATQTLYRRVGYELAGTWTVFRLHSNQVEHRDRTLDIELVGPSAIPELRDVYTARARATAGQLDRSERFWSEQIFGEWRGRPHAYVVRRDGRAEGYCVFSQATPSDGGSYDLVMRDLVALTPAAADRLWTFFADHRSFAGDVRWVGAANDPVFFRFREPAWKVKDSWSWMTRIVDVRGALGARGYPAASSAEIHLQVRDDVLPWNDGRFVLSVADGSGTVRKGGKGRLRIDVRGLASLFTGFASAHELRATGLVEGAERDLALADGLFGGPAPWLADFY